MSITHSSEQHADQHLLAHPAQVWGGAREEGRDVEDEAVQREVHCRGREFEVVEGPQELP